MKATAIHKLAIDILVLSGNSLSQRERSSEESETVGICALRNSPRDLENVPLIPSPPFHSKPA